MSSRNGAGPSRGAAVGPQPLKATVPYQLANKPPSTRRDEKSVAGKAKAHQQSSGMRRTVSLDAIVGPYLQGHWPKEPEGQVSLSRKDKSTQTPDSRSEKTLNRRGSSSHKRSASWSSAEHLREIGKLKQQLQQRSKPGVSAGHDKDGQHAYPQGSSSLGKTQTQPIPIPVTPLSTLVPRLCCSVEGLNQELEGMFVCQSPTSQQELLEVPDGHRAPVPSQSSSSSSGSQSDPSVTLLFPYSTSSSPCSPPATIAASPSIPEDTLLDSCQGVTDSADMGLLSPFSSHSEPELSLLMSSSPGPNKTSSFNRDPPEGCEKVRVSDDTSAPQKPKPAVISSCPDPNKVNFTPHGGSAFCPVSLRKPLLPSMDLLFRSLSVSPSNTYLGQGAASSQATSTGNRAASADPPAAAVTPEDPGENPTL